MSTPSTTMARFLRWRLRDCLSCFLPSRLPLDDYPDRVCTSSPQLHIKNMVFDIKKDEKRGKRGCKKSSRRNINRNEEQVNHDLALDRNIENMSNDSGWPHFQDEDYIVFCFREDGAFDVVKDGKLEALELFDSGNRIPMPVLRKLNYGEVAQTLEKSSHKKSLRVGQGLNPAEKDEEEESSYLDIESHCVGSARRYKCEEMENHGIVSVESRDSNQSESTTGSFSFPIVQWELMGSPAQMPKSQGLYIRKHKLTCARFHCCRF